ncbi:MAG: tRNA pseudouridine(38-40) synthase TruA [Armatimonadota bacterium]
MLPEPKGKTRRILIVVEYDGTDYAGFQRQPDVPTIQGELEQALGQLLGEPTHLTAASRTDAGVHALGQVAVFSTDSSIPVENLPRALNNILSPAVSVVGACEVSAGFHPRFDAIGKQYTYRVLNRKVRSPFICRYAWLVTDTLERSAMRAAAEVLVGEHDFAAFCASGSSVRSTVRYLYRLDVDENADLIEFRVAADGFLYMMVRIIVGTLVEVGLGRRTPEDVAAVLASGDRRRAGPTAPPQGLCLVRVDY